MSYWSGDEDEEATVDIFKGVTVQRETEKAVLVTLPEFGGDKDVQVWVLKSVITDDSEVHDVECYNANGPGKLVVKGWWTEKALDSHKKAKAIRAKGRPA
jgi:hypothetical protein